MTKRIDITGQRNGRLVAIKCIGLDPSNHPLWSCQCDCGKTSSVTTSNFRRKQIRTMSCGCYKLERASELGKKYGTLNSAHKYRHGHSFVGKMTREYQTWASMLARVGPTSKDRIHYYDRGITVCERWRSFENFLADMGSKPKGMTLDRKNNNGNYEKLNCRWATWSQQALNKRPGRPKSTAGFSRRDESAER